MTAGERSNGRARLFPVGLYATLLGALCWLAVPQLSAPLERTTLALGALPLQAYAAGFGVRGTPETGVVLREAELLLDLQGRQEAVAVAGGGTLVPAGLNAVHCRVLSLRGRGGGGQSAELLLDRSYRELSGSARYVTFGGSLVGFLATPGEGAAARDRWDDPARVLLLNHREAHTVPAELFDPVADTHLQFAVEPAGSVDRWPLRTTFLDDPYRMARLRHRGLEVRTIELDQSVFPALVPAGLLLGHNRIWGYPDLPIGIFVAPDPAPHTLASVVVWRPSGDPERLRQPFDVGHAVPVRLLELPGPEGTRFYVDGVRGEMPDGAALVDGVRLLGRVRAFAFGSGRAEPFGEPGQRWELLFLPEEVDARPQPLTATVVQQDDGIVLLRDEREPRSEVSGLPPGSRRGWLFTGVNGLHCPAGLYLGPVRAHPDDDRLRVLRWAGYGQRRGQGLYIHGAEG